MQLFVRSLQNGSVPIDVAPDTTIDEFRREIQFVCGVPASLLRLRCGTRELVEGTVDSIAAESTVHVLLRLVGGKGGFGSLLRVQGRDTKATTNFDACRDLSGRRLRDVNAVKKLEEWKNNAKDRELEDIALKYIDKESKRRRKESQPTLDSTIVSNAHKELISKVKDAVESSTNSKKPKQTLSQSKKPRFLYDASSSDDDSEASEGNEDEEDSFKDKSEGVEHVDSFEDKSEGVEHVDSFEDKSQQGKRKRSQSKD